MAEPIIPAYIGLVDGGYRSAVMFRCLKELSARTKYYFEQHKKRWEQRYGRPYPQADGEVGTIGNIRWITR